MPSKEFAKILEERREAEQRNALREFLRRESERLEFERQMKSEDNKRLMYVDPTDKRFTL